MTDLYWFLLGVLAVWRVTLLFNAEDGPWDIMVRFRRFVGNRFWGKLLDCFSCLTVWVAAPAAWLLGAGWKERVFLWLALSAGAILIERLTHRQEPVAPAIYHEDEEVPYGMLRKPESTTQPDSNPPGPSAP
jgi:hypothetical protein